MVRNEALWRIPVIGIELVIFIDNDLEGSSFIDVF